MRPRVPRACPNDHVVFVDDEPDPARVRVERDRLSGGRYDLGAIPARQDLAHGFQDGLYWSTASQEFAEVAVARLRASVTRYPGDGDLHSLIGELRSASAWFSDLWAREPTNLPGRRSKTILHPHLGPVPVTCDILLVPGDDRQVVFITPKPDTSLQEALHTLDAAS